LRPLGVAELPSTVGVAARLDDTAARVDAVEAVLGIGGEYALEL
jgi:hypothetical protein